MKYIFIRLIIFIFGLIVIYYISDFIQNNTVIEDGGCNFKGIIWFFRLVLGFVIVSLGIFANEARLFHKQNKIKQRNTSFILIGIITLFMVLFGGYFLEFVV